ncbi:ferredoxin-type protein NapF [Aliamphritea hakodatensis]|uniref:ferredoxin-type protein NapF n=1 Tax=Aliamphritea hakodatensis TaxID=2895352 RepID=UPI0022FD62B2|nr:ferredoxin-type protein NapF [Aliamphritea hakodatensis]
MVDLSRRALFRGRVSRDQAGKPLRQNLPWIKDEQLFLADCHRCDACIKQCETQIITRGDGGFPTIDFSRGECTFCYQCASACDQPLFWPETEQPWTQTIEIGAKCLTNSGVECRSCEDSCEPYAISFRPRRGQVSPPQIDTDQCNGCGACIRTCPGNAITINHGVQL